MNYTFEIKKLSPKQEFMTVVYRSDGYPDYTRNFNPKQFDEASIASIIEGGAQAVVEFWERWSEHPENVQVSMTGSGTFSPVVPVEVPANHMPVPEDEPEFDVLTQRIQLKKIEDPAQETVGWDIIELTAEERVEVFETISFTARQQRNFLLAETDYFLLSDTPEPTQEILAYRQALRDITSQDGFPANISWPTKPEGVA